MLALYAEFGKRRILDEKLHNELIICLIHGGNPAVTLMSADGTTFFTYLTVAAECGDMELVKKFLEEFREEFSEYDIKASLHGALAHKEQEIAEYLLRETEVVPDRDTVMEMFDIQMNDDCERKVLPLIAFLERCVDTGKFPLEEFVIPEILNCAIYAHNVAALEVLFDRRKDEFLPLLEQFTPDAKIIRAGRGKTQDIGEGVPPLAYAAIMERPGCLEVFLKYGANPNFMWNEMGGTLLHIVGHKGNTEMIELLINYHADPRIPNDRGVLALSRTKGRKARKCITDAIDHLNQLDGIHGEIPPLPHHDEDPFDSVAVHLQNPMGMSAAHAHAQFVGLGNDPTIVLSEGTSMNSFNSIMASDNDDQGTPLPPELQMQQPPPFANQHQQIVDIPGPGSMMSADHQFARTIQPVAQMQNVQSSTHETSAPINIPNEPVSNSVALAPNTFSQDGNIGSST
mmetsp:Transcript_130439/g.194169  ORF Transcript_130439/g.194169 Transcript_130439/m.194169 type:complete len:457 (+) Transcript_130439:459-1829(+)